MQGLHLEAVVIGWRRCWGKWPDTDDMDYTLIRDSRQELQLSESQSLLLRVYPVHRAFARTGTQDLPTKHPFINNTIIPNERVLKRMVKDLEDIARDGCRICIWEHARFCYPEVAQHLKRIFDVSILIHCDDSEGPQGSTELRTRPVAQYFDAVLHGNVIWTKDGQTTMDLYRSFGLKHVRFFCMGTTGGFCEELFGGLLQVETGICPISYVTTSRLKGVDISRRMKQFSVQNYDYDIVFVGGLMGKERVDINSSESMMKFEGVGLKTKIAGIGMRDGPLLPRVAETLGGPVAKLYLKSFAVLNLPFIGLMGTRPYDAWLSGNPLVQHDPVGELKHLGIESGVHYIDYDGTVDHLIEQVLYYKNNLRKLEVILRLGQAKGRQLMSEYSLQKGLMTLLEEIGI